MPQRIRKGDMVAVISGDDRGKRGRVLRIDYSKDRVIIEGVKLVYKHMRRSQKHPQGGRIRREAAVHLSNVMPVDPETNERARVRVESRDGKRVRVARRTGAVLGADAGAKKAAKSED